MLANLTSLIWGSETTTPTTTGAAPSPATKTPSSSPPSATPWEDAPEEGTQSAYNIRASTPADEEEADWVLVERATSPSSSLPPTDASGDAAMTEASEEDGGESGRQVAEAPPAGRTGVTQRTASLLQAIDVLRPAQKAQRRREERRLKRTPLERSNKAREVAASSNKRTKRCDMMMPGKFSRAVNNRKC